MRRLAILIAFFTLSVVEHASSRGPANPRGSTSGDDIVREMNLARQHPAIYAGYIEELRRHFRGNILVLPGQIGRAHV